MKVTVKAYNHRQRIVLVEDEQGKQFPVNATNIPLQHTARGSVLDIRDMRMPQQANPAALPEHRASSSIDDRIAEYDSALADMREKTMQYLAHINPLLRIVKRGYEVSRKKAELHFQRGSELESRGELPEALEDYVKAYMISPDNEDYSQAVKTVASKLKLAIEIESD